MRRSCRQVIGRFDANETMIHLTQNNGGADIRCLACRAECVSNVVWGRFVAEVVCNAKCTGAVGHSCDCSCGGVNHGGKFGV